jgi:glycosyltransferase involved in cell wall biosynthesis
VAPDDPSALADGLYSLWHDRPLASAMGQRGYHGVRAHYTIAQSADRLLEVYAAITNPSTERHLPAAAGRA